MAVLRVSFTNLAEATAASVTAYAQACNYCSSEIQQPQRPFRTWRAACTSSTQELLVDLGSSQTVQLVALVNANFSCAKIQGASSSGLFAAPPYNESVTIARSPHTWRWQHAHLTTGFGYRWLRVYIACQTPADGSTYFSLGGVWVAGDLTSAPTHLLWGSRFRTILPKIDVGPAHEAWFQRLKVGQPRAQIDGLLSASVTAATPATNDALDSWLDVIRQAWSADYTYTYLNLGDPAQGYVVRFTDSPDWLVEGRQASLRLILDEVAGP